MFSVDVHKVRLGFATNSSSMHSLIFIPGGAEDYDVEYGDFGWQYFTAGSAEAKSQYLACLVYNGMRKFTSNAVALLVAREWLSVPQFDTDSHVDHQSCFAFPNTWEGDALDEDFFKAFKEFFLQKDLVILGGNDNVGDKHPLLTHGERVSVPLPDYPPDGGFVARWDARGKFWTLFNRATGAKVRLSFSNRDYSVNVDRSEVPDLVDIKITDYCPMGCSFCYQASTEKGQHADAYVVSDILRELSDLKVFEVALGGGEPTLHPDFLYILEAARGYHIIPNFTTRSTAWLRNDTARERALKACGAFAYSAQTLDEVNALVRLLLNLNVPAHKVNIQLVVGVVPDEQLYSIMRVCSYNNIRVTLLGYKQTGRGKTYIPSRHSGWIATAKSVSESYYGRSPVGIDTALATEYAEQLQAAKVSEEFYEVHEGRFSMYIDAVSKQMAPCSYASVDTYKDLPLGWGSAEQIKEIYSGFY